MQKVVIDTSVIVKWLSTEQEKYVDQVDLLLTRATENKIELNTSELAKYEVGNVLLKSKYLANPQATASLATLYSLPINFHQQSPERSAKAYDVATNSKLSYYDASFVSLAKELDAILITDDRQLAKKSSQTHKTTLISNYR